MSSKRPKNDDYYPMRWKFADAVENIIILYQTKAAIAVAAFGLGFILLGLLVLGWRPFGGDTEEVVAQNPAIETTEDTTPEGLNPDSVRRTVATAEQVATTPSGAVIQLGPRAIQIVGGAPSDEVADDIFDTTLRLFPDREVLDTQLLSIDFVETDEIVVRVVEPDFFIGDTAELNPDLIGLITAVATTVQQSDGMTVLVVGHAATGPLGTERAEEVSNELIRQGLTIEQTSYTSVGSSEPINGVSNRIDFILR